MKNPAPYRYDIVGSFLRTKAIHEARSRFEAGEISAEELARVEDAEITGLVKKEENVGLHAVTDGEYRRSFWHMDFLWGLTGTQKVKSEHFSVAFKGFQPKAETVKIVDRLDFPDDHPFLRHFAFLQSVASDLVQPKQCIPSPSMLHLICCVRSTDENDVELLRQAGLSYAMKTGNPCVLRLFQTLGVGQNALAHTDALRGDLEQLVVRNELKRSLDGHLTRRNKAQRIIRTGSTHIGQLLLLAYVYSHILTARVLTDDHAFVYHRAGSDEQRAALLRVEQAIAN